MSCLKVVNQIKINQLQNILKIEFNNTNRLYIYNIL